jgi:hypothetical protein
MDAPGQQRVVAEVDARHDMRGAEGHLLGFGKEVVGVAVEHHAADRRTGTSSSGMSLVASRTSKLKASACFLGEHLQAQLVFGEGTRLDALPQVAAVEVRVGAGDLDRLVPHSECVPSRGRSSGT